MGMGNTARKTSPISPYRGKMAREAMKTTGESRGGVLHGKEIVMSAKALGLTMPPHLLILADEVLQ
jgi:hypothetical protein